VVGVEVAWTWSCSMSRVRAAGEDPCPGSLEVHLIAALSQRMARSTSGTPKKRGRPATGRDPLVTARLRAEMIANVEACAANHEVTRSEAIRRLVELGLNAAPPKPRKGRKVKQRSARYDHVGRADNSREGCTPALS
jgi:hypothetical protein